MKIYIGASFSSRTRLRPIRDELWKMGHEVVSSWLDEVAKPEQMTHQEFYKKLALKDLCELKSADLAVIDLFDTSTTGGRDTELGFALASFSGKQVYTVGPTKSVFHELVDKQFVEWKEVLNYLVPGGPTSNAKAATKPSTLMKVPF